MCINLSVFIYKIFSCVRSMSIYGVGVEYIVLQKKMRIAVYVIIKDVHFQPLSSFLKNTIYK